MNSTNTGAISARLVEPAQRSHVLWHVDPAAPATISMFGFVCANATLAAATRDLIAAARMGRRTRVVFANAHVANETRRDASYRAVVASADKVYADGSGMAIAARLAGHCFIDNVNGTDMFPVLAAAAASAGTPMFLLGGKPGVARDAAEAIAALGHAGAIAGTHHGYFAHGSEDEAKIIDMINASGARIVLVAMGVPLQDQWIAANAHRLNAAVLIGVGGLFDFFAGRVERAPVALRGRGLEWVWRLAQEPGRMWRRYIIGNPLFIAAALREAVRSRLTTASARP